VIAIDGIKQISQMRQRGVKVRKQRHVGPSAREIAQVDRRDEHCLVPDRSTTADVAARTHQHRRAGEHLAALAPDEVRERHEHAMLFGNVANEALPSRYRSWARNGVLTRPDTASRSGGGKENQLRIVEGGHRS
jgi:hypothetical protein